MEVSTRVAVGGTRKTHYVVRLTRATQPTTRNYSSTQSSKIMCSNMCQMPENPGAQFYWEKLGCCWVNTSRGCRTVITCQTHDRWQGLLLYSSRLLTARWSFIRALVMATLRLTLPEKFGAVWKVWSRRPTPRQSAMISLAISNASLTVSHFLNLNSLFLIPRRLF